MYALALLTLGQAYIVFRIGLTRVIKDHKLRERKSMINATDRRITETGFVNSRNVFEKRRRFQRRLLLVDLTLIKFRNYATELGELWSSKVCTTLFTERLHRI